MRQDPPVVVDLVEDAERLGGRAADMRRAVTCGVLQEGLASSQRGQAPARDHPLVTVAAVHQGGHHRVDRLLPSGLPAYHGTRKSRRPPGGHHGQQPGFPGELHRRG